ncbi:MAG TPA: hypothetical protein PK225_02460 [Azonexus sp.]|nr:hypothetical protein [Azonexus sp.]
MTAAAFSKNWNRRAESAGCPARAQFSKRSAKYFEFRGDTDGGCEIWWPISAEKWDSIVRQYPATAPQF